MHPGRVIYELSYIAGVTLRRIPDGGMIPDPFPRWSTRYKVYNSLRQKNRWLITCLNVHPVDSKSEALGKDCRQRSSRQKRIFAAGSMSLSVLYYRVPYSWCLYKRYITIGIAAGSPDGYPFIAVLGWNRCYRNGFPQMLGFHVIFNGKQENTFAGVLAQE